MMHRPVYKFFIVIFLLFLFPFLTIESEKRVFQLKNLEYNNPELMSLRKEIAQNLRASARGHGLAVPLRIVSYKVRGNENFYTIMARLSQDSDTLSSINELANPNALKINQIIRIPNARGVFKTKSEFNKMKKNSQKKPEYIVDGFYFFPGEKMPREQIQMFRGEGFYHPLGKKIGRISSRFGLRNDPFRNKRTFHGGLDIAAKSGTHVFASRNGEVIRAQKNVRGYGTLLVLSHDYGYQTWYGHLQSLNVVQGQTIKTGQKIGRVGSTGLATGPHLHFEIRKNGRKKNPEQMIHRF